MELMILSVFSVLAFCLCCRFLILAIRKPLPVFRLQGYNRRALRVQKSFLIFAWGVMTGSFLFALVASFVRVYTTL